MGCQHSVVDKIIDKQANYIIAVKDNQPSLAQAIENLFDANQAGQLAQALERDVSLDKGHGRLESRQCTVANDLQALGEQAHAWQGLSSVARIECTREAVNGKNKGQCGTERRYYISSLPLSASQFNEAVRAHWGIENSCHWVLDMTFNEDGCRIRIGDGAENFAILRRIALMPKSANELRGLGLPKTELNPWTSQLSRWSSRFGMRPLRELGRTVGGKAVSATATAALIADGFYNWYVIGRAAFAAMERDENCECDHAE